MAINGVAWQLVSMQLKPPWLQSSAQSKEQKKGRAAQQRPIEMEGSISRQATTKKMYTVIVRY